MRAKDWILPGLLFLFQILVLAHYGFSSNDYGYIYGLAWRVIEGQSIYTDFLSARPPLSPYLASFWLYVLPEDGQYYYTRIVNYVYAFLISYAQFVFISRHFDDFYKSLNKGLFLVVLMIFNINYIVHFWHTTDGLLMMSFALLIGFTKNAPGIFRIIAMSFFIILAMSAKQSFYPLPFFTAFFFYFTYGKRKFFEFIFTFAVELLLLLLCAYSFFHDQLFAYMSFKQYESQIGPFLEAAFVYYIMGFIYTAPILLLIAYVAGRKKISLLLQKKRYYDAYSRVTVIFSKYFIIGYGLLLLQFSQIKVMTGTNVIVFHTPLLGGFSALILWIIIDFITKQNRDVKSYVALFLLLSIAWCSSLSWGYKTPSLYSGAIIFGFMYIYWLNTKKQIEDYIMYGVVFIYAFAILLLQIHNFSAKSYDLGIYSKKLSGIYQRNPAEMTELSFVNKKVQECKKEGKTYTVLASSPYVHWIYDDYPTLSLDWVSNVEMLNKQDRLKKEIDSVDCVVIDPYYIFWDNKRFGFDTNKFLGRDYKDFQIKLN